MNWLSPSVIILFLISYFSHFIIGEKVFGLLLIAFIPGLYYLKLVGLDKKINNISLIGFSFAVSAAVMSLASIFLALQKPFSMQSQVAVVLIVNILGYLLFLYFRREDKTLFPKKWSSAEKTMAAIGLIPFLLFIIRSILNPYIQDLDGSLYVDILNLINKFGADYSFLNGGRTAFAHYIVPFNALAHYPYLTLIKFVLPGIIWLEFTAIYAFLNDKSHKLLYWLPLVFLASPALIGQIDRFKPESIIYPIVGIVAFIFYKTIADHDWAIYILGLVIALFAAKTHETGILILLCYLGSMALVVATNYKKYIPKFTLNKLIIGLIILIPYVILLKPQSLVTVLVHAMTLFAPAEGYKFGFRLWFLDNYTALGMQLGWPSWKFILFYLFNGIFPTLIFFYLAGRVLKRKLWQPFLFLLSGGAIFLTITEILTRFNIFFLPDRAWAELSLYGAIFLVAYFGITNWKPSSSIFSRTIITLLALNVICSLALATYLGYSSSSLIQPSEFEAINKIAQTEENAVIFTTQPLNERPIKTYGHRAFSTASIDTTEAKNLDEFKQLILNKIDLGEITLFPKDLQGTRASITTVVDKLYIGDAFIVPTEMNMTGSLKGPLAQELKIAPDRPVYFFYSFAKTSSLMNAVGRQYISSDTDAKNKEQLKELKENNSLYYSDDATILIKLR